MPDVQWNGVLELRCFANDLAQRSVRGQRRLTLHYSSGPNESVAANSRPTTAAISGAHSGTFRGTTTFCKTRTARPARLAGPHTRQARGHPRQKRQSTGKMSRRAWQSSGRRGLSTDLNHHPHRRAHTGVLNATGITQPPAHRSAVGTLAARCPSSDHTPKPTSAVEGLAPHHCASSATRTETKVAVAGSISLPYRGVRLPTLAWHDRQDNTITHPSPPDSSVSLPTPTVRFRERK